MKALLSSALLLSLACGSQAPRPPASDGGPLPGTDGGAPASDGGPIVTPGASLTVAMAGAPIAPGGETTFCVVRRLENPETALITRIETTLSEGSHHLVVYRSDEAQERTQPFRCSPFTEIVRGHAVPLLISQIREEALALPAGVVYEIAPRQMVRIEAHYFNAGSAPITPEASVTFRTVLDQPGLERADFLFFGTFDIDLPPDVPTTVGPRFIAEGIPAGAKIFAMTTHTHQWGTQFRVQKSTSRADPGTGLYDYPDWSWDEPPVARFDPPLTFAPGEGVRFTCEYLNRSGGQVGFGESAEEEMCFLWLYYYPSAGYRICVDTDYYGAGQVCCPGDPVCGFLGAF
jgi:hypothetical protein